MKKLYSAAVARPLSAPTSTPTRLGFATTAWCPYEDLIAVISGDGAVAVFHADSPGETSLLVAAKRAPARHLLWRNSPDKPCMLVVADAAARLTFWVARDCRVNVWVAVASLELPCVVSALSWNANSTALAAVLAHGDVRVWLVPDIPSDKRAAHPAYSQSRQRAYVPEVRPGSTIRPVLYAKSQKIADLLGGQLRCATVAPGHQEPTGVAIVTVSAAHPTRLNVWTVSISKAPQNPTFELRAVSSTDLDLSKDGNCVACLTFPFRGMLFAIGHRGKIVRWHYQNSRPPGESRWVKKASVHIEAATADAAKRGIIPAISDYDTTLNSVTRGLVLSRRKKVYAFHVSDDCKTLVTSTASGLLVWETDTLKITRGHPLLQNPTGKPASPYWGLCVSPAGGAVVALAGSGRVETHSLICPVIQGSKDVIEKNAATYARRLVQNTTADGRRGGWDIIASIAIEGPIAAANMANILSLTSMRGGQDPPSQSKIANLDAVMRGIEHPDGNAARAARQLIEVALCALQKSAPEKVRFMLGQKEVRALFSADSVRKVIQQAVMASPVSIPELAAAPLADWLMVLGAVWLQKCASFVVKHDAKGQCGSEWVRLSSINPVPQSDKPRGILADPAIVKCMRPAAIAAALLLGMEKRYGEQEAYPRYYRFPQNENADIVACIWEVTSAWERDNLGKPIPGSTNVGIQLPHQNADRVANTVTALSKHTAAALAMIKAKELRVSSAERALGLHGSATGAGFIATSARNHVKVLAGDKKQNQKNGSQRTDWCPYDLVTGRPLPPWAPLRRCVASGLLAVEIAQQRAPGHPSVNTASPWVANWANQSPFGGRWARVPSIDLDRYELLVPSVAPASERPDHHPTLSRVTKTEETVAPNILPVQSTPKPQTLHPPSHAPSPYQTPNLLRNPQLQVTQSEAAAIIAQTGRIPQGMFRGNPQLPSGMAPRIVPGMSAGALSGGRPLIPNALAAGVPTNATPRNMMQHQYQNGMTMAPAGRIQASPQMTTVSSTTDVASTTSQGRKRPGGLGRSGKSKKRADSRTANANPYAEMPSAQPGSVAPSVSAALSGNIVRQSTPADAVSADNRSSRTNATNTTSGVQDTSAKRKRPRSKTKHSPARTGASNSRSVIGTSAGRQGVPTALHQVSSASHVPRTPRGATPSKPQQIRTPSAVAAAAAEAAAAAAAANPSNPLHSRQIPLMQSKPGLSMGLNPHVLAGIGMGNNGDHMSHLNFVQGMGGPGVVSSMALSLDRDNRPMMGAVGNPGVIPGTSHTAQGLHTAMGSGVFGTPGIDGSLMNLNPQGVPNMHIPGTNAMYPTQAGPASSLTPMGLNIMSAAQLHSLSPEKRDQAIDAMQRRIDREQFYGDAAQLRAGMSMAQGVPANGALGPNTVLNADPSGNPTNPAINRVIGGTPATPGSQIDSSMLNTRNMINTAASLGSIQPGLTLGAPRTSAAESQTSTRVTGPRPRAHDNDATTGNVLDNGNRVAAGAPNSNLPGNVMGPNAVGMGGIPAPKLQSGAMGVGGLADNGVGMNVIDGNDQVLSTNTVGPQAGSIPSPIGAAPPLTSAATNGRRLWIGTLCVWGNSSTHKVNCVAISGTMRGQPVIQDTRSWPERLDCDHGKMRKLDLRELQGAQWYVRFVPIDPSVQNVRVTNDLVKVMLNDSFTFQIPCTEQEGTPGSLLLFGMRMGVDQTALMGVFKPSINNDIMMMMDNVIPIAPKQ